MINAKKRTGRWRPETWEEIIGNTRLKRYCCDFIRAVRTDAVTTGFDALVTGASRSGKNATINLLLQSMACLNLDFTTFNPCRTCAHCVDKVHIHGNRNWENYQSFLTEDEVKTPISLHVSVVNSPDLDAESLRELLLYVRREDSRMKIVCMDEILRLDHKLVAKLLAPMDLYDATFIAMSAYLARQNSSGSKSMSSNDIEKAQILKMFEGRFTFRLETEPPHTEEMFEWLARRCDEFGVRCQDPRTTLIRLIERSSYTPGLAIQVLKCAQSSADRVLTSAMVEECVFPQ